MKIYRLNGIYYEKQADCPSKGFETVEFPFAATPKADFVAWLNQIEQRGPSLPAPVQEVESFGTSPPPPAPPPELTRRLEAVDHTTRLIAMQSDRLALELVIEDAPLPWLDTIIELAAERKERAHA